MAWRPLLGIILCVDVLVYTNYRFMSAREVARGINFGRRVEIG